LVHWDTPPGMKLVWSSLPCSSKPPGFHFAGLRRPMISATGNRQRSGSASREVAAWAFAKQLFEWKLRSTSPHTSC
jgi:hypothetical protein